MEAKLKQTWEVVGRKAEIDSVLGSCTLCISPRLHDTADEPNLLPQLKDRLLGY